MFVYWIILYYTNFVYILYIANLWGLQLILTIPPVFGTITKYAMHQIPKLKRIFPFPGILSTLEPCSRPLPTVSTGAPYASRIAWCFRHHLNGSQTPPFPPVSWGDISGWICDMQNIDRLTFPDLRFICQICSSLRIGAVGQFGICNGPRQNTSFQLRWIPNEYSSEHSFLPNFAKEIEDLSTWITQDFT